MDEGVAIEQARIYAVLEEQVKQYACRNRHLEAIGTVGRIIGGVLALPDVLDQTLDATLKVMGMEAGEIWLLDTATQAVCLTRQLGLEPEAFGERTRFALGEGIPGRVAQTGEVVVIPDLAADPRFLRYKVVAAGFKTFAAFPLRAKGEVIGVLDIATRRMRVFTEDDTKLVTAIGAAVGMAVINARIYEDLRLTTKRLEASLEELRRSQNQLVAAERLRAMGELAAGVAHDLNNALMGVLGQTQLMQLTIARGTFSKDHLSGCLSLQERLIADATRTIRRLREAAQP